MSQRFLDVCDSLILNAPSGKQQQLLKQEPQQREEPPPPPPPPPPQRRQSQPVGTILQSDNFYLGKGLLGVVASHRSGVGGYRHEATNRIWSVTGIKGYNDASPRGQSQRNNTQGGTDSTLSSRNGSSKQVNQGGLHNHGRIQRQRSLKNSSDDSIKWPRPHPSSYQLSQELHDKQVEMLERKYGGSIRSRRAARTIQRAFRQYCMNKNFQKLRHSYGERRLSKRLSELGRSNTVWSDRLSSDATGAAGDNRNNNNTSQGEDTFGRSIRDMVADFECASRSPEISMGQKRNYESSAKSSDHRPIKDRFSDSQKGDIIRNVDRGQGVQTIFGKENQHSHLSHNFFSSPDFYLDGFYSKSPRSKSSSVSSQGSNTSVGDVYFGGESTNSKGQYEMNSSGGGGDFMRTPAVENTVDPHSMDFETLLENNKETDILTESFNSDGSVSQDLSGSGFHCHKPPAPCTGSHCIDHSSDIQRFSSSPDSYRSISLDPNNFTSGINSCPEKKFKSTLSGDNPQMHSQEEMTATSIKLKMTAPKFRLNNRDVNSSGQSHNAAIVPPTRASSSSPIWRRKGSDHSEDQHVSNGTLPSSKGGEPKRMSNISETSEPESIEGGHSGSQSVASTESVSGSSDNSLSYQRKLRMNITNDSQTVPRVNDKIRKRLYRIGLNLFNKKPEKGLDFLLDNLFLEGSPKSVARFFITRKGLSKQMIGEFLGNLQNPFSQEVLQCFCEEIDLSGLHVDAALRKFQCHFRMPGEAQKIERLMEAFADRYCECNPDLVKTFKNPDTVFLLAFAIIMLNTDLHNLSVKAERKMKLEEFIKNMRGIDDGDDIDPELLTGIYERVKLQEFKAGVDQVTQVMKVEQTIIGKKPTLSLPHRRLVCYCRLYEVHDPQKKEKIGLHQREVFLFNDLLLITKIFSKKKAGITYSCRSSLSLCGMQVYLFETSHYQFGIQLTNNIDGKPLITFNARNNHDRHKFVEDLRESILETNGMEQIRIEEEMARHHTTHNTMDKRYACDDSRVPAYDLAKASENPHNRLSAPECNLKKVPYSNSLTDLSSDPVMKRGSSGASLDSGVASGSVGSASSDTQHSSVFNPSPTASGQQPQGTPPLGQGTNKRLSPLKTAVIPKSGLPDGTQV